jgi:hypothetical protein
MGMAEQFFTVPRKFNKPAIAKLRKRPLLQLYNVKRMKQRSKESSRSARKYI